MDTQIFGPGDVWQLAELLLRGGVAAFPTDTVYGVAAHPSYPEAVEQLFIAKQRPLDKAIPILLADLADVERVAERPGRAALTLAEAFWPGALTIVVPRRRQRPDDLPTVAVRIPALELARDIIRAAGGSLAVTSANISGGPDCSTAQAVLAQLGGRIDALLDGGPCPGGVASTVVDATREPVRVLRSGGVPVEALRRIIPIEES